jgi:4-azaleucine resistance transporter AzlC
MIQPPALPDNRDEFVRGLRRSLPIVLAVLPFGLLFGALAVDNGLSLGEAVLMSTLIYAGASQLVGIELFGQHVAPWLIVLSIFAVNFRHVLYSAVAGRRTRHWPALARAVGFFFLVDPQFAEVERRVDEGKPITVAWYAGVALPVYVAWVAETAVGGYFGGLVPNPHAIGLDFLLPIYFLGLVMEFRGRALWLPVVAASAAVSIVAERLVGSPWHVTIGALAGIAVAVIFTPSTAPRHGIEDAAQ